jgi:hypothetical protein
VLRGDLGPAGAPRGYSVSGGASGGRNDSLVPCKGDLTHPPPPHVFACSAGASRGTFLAVLRGDLGPAGAPRGYSVSGGASGGHNDSLEPCKKDLTHPPPPHPLYKGFWGVGEMPVLVIVIFLNS